LWHSFTVPSKGSYFGLSDNTYELTRLNNAAAGRGRWNSSKSPAGEFDRGLIPQEAEQLHELLLNQWAKSYPQHVLSARVEEAHQAREFRRQRRATRRRPE